MKTRLRFLIGLGVLAGLAALLGLPTSWDTGKAARAASAGPPEVGQAIKHDVSPPLRQIPPKPPRSGEDHELPLQPLPRAGPKLPQHPGGDPNLQTTVGPGSMPAPAQNFDGVNNVDGVIPPDTNGDVGPNHYVQWVNLSFAIYNKSGTKVYPTSGTAAAGSTLWSGFGGDCETGNDGDPIALYDPLADRWLMSQFALPNYPNGPFYQCVAVSQTADPTGAYYRYSFLFSNSLMNDYPKFGVWPDGYYMAVNEYNGNSFAGAGVMAFERSKMLDGLPAQTVYFDVGQINANLGGFLPSDLDGPNPPPSGAPNYFAEIDDGAWGYTGGVDQLELWAFHVDWNNTANSTFSHLTDLATNSFDSNLCNYSRNCIPQPRPGKKLDALSDRLMYRLQYRKFGDHESLVTNHTVDVGGNDHAGVRWYELRKTGGSWSIFQQGTYAPDASHRWMGSIAMDGSGNMALGYSVSASNSNPSIRYTGRLAGDASGSMTQGESTMQAGGGVQTYSGGRWGDYSMMAVDPTDDCTFWYTNEYYPATSNAGWHTRIGSFKFPSCSGSSGPTSTPTATGSVTATASPTSATTATSTVTPTATTALATATSTPSATASRTPTATNTLDPLSFTPTPTATSTATNTPVLLTSTPTATSTATPTATATSTLSATSTPAVTATPTATGTTGTNPYSLSLNGTSGYAQAPDATPTPGATPELNLTGDWTIETWFKDETPGGFGHTTNKFILIKGTTSGSEVPYYIYVGSNLLQVRVRTGGISYGASYDLAANGVDPSLWHHLAATFAKATRTLTVYLDGVQRASAVLGASTNTGNTEVVSIGRNGTLGYYWQGKLDDVRIWNVVRSANDISANYKNEFASPQTNLVANWRFDEGSGTTAADNSTTPENATLSVAGATFSNDVHAASAAPELLADGTQPVASGTSEEGVTPWADAQGGREQRTGWQEGVAGGIRSATEVAISIWNGQRGR